MEENKNTIMFNKNIVGGEKPSLTPGLGDTFIFQGSEDSAFEAYLDYAGGAVEPCDEKFITDMFKLPKIGGTVCNPLYINGKRYGFFGYRINVADNPPKGRFYLYEMD